MNSLRSGENHHWWPIGLSKGWARPDGKINTVSQHGVPKAYYPKQIAKIEDGHNVIVGGPWDHSFERDFDEPDNNFPALVEWLEGLHSEPYRADKRVRSLEIDDARKRILSQCLASLIVRNPTMRNAITLAVEDTHHRMGFTDYRIPHHLIAVNQRHLYASFWKSIDQSGRFAVLVSEHQEFMFGDGFLHNFPITWMPAPSNGICLVPLSPKVSVLYQRPMQLWSEPKAVALTLAPSEVAFCNDTVQVYSKDWLYYRDSEPKVTHFKDGRHMIWSYPIDGWDTSHTLPVFENLKAEVLAHHPYRD